VEKVGGLLAGTYHPGKKQPDSELATFAAVRRATAARFPEPLKLPKWEDDASWHAATERLDAAIAEVSAAERAAEPAASELATARVALEQAERELAIGTGNDAKVNAARKRLAKAEVAADNAQQRRANASRMRGYVVEAEADARREAQERNLAKLKALYADGIERLRGALLEASEHSEYLWHVYMHVRNQIGERPIESVLAQRDWAFVLAQPGQAQGGAVMDSGQPSRLRRWLGEIDGFDPSSGRPTR
jgi:hypothetical protein